MKLSVQVTAPQLQLLVANPRETVEAMTRDVVAQVRDRTRRGQGADKALPAPKDGGQPLRRTGSLQASIGYVMRTARGTGAPVGVVRALGPRPKVERADIQRKRAAAARRTAEGRAAFAEVALGAGGAARSHYERQARRYRVRTAVDQASLAAILSTPPRDLRARNGGRAIYIVFRAREDEVRRARDVANRTVRVSLTSAGTFIIKG